MLGVLFEDKLCGLQSTLVLLVLIVSDDGTEEGCLFRGERLRHRGCGGLSIDWRVNMVRGRYCREPGASKSGSAVGDHELLDGQSGSSEGRTVCEAVEGTRKLLAGGIKLAS